MITLSADRPSSNPKEDLFGHTPFAKSLANSICRYSNSDGLVLALYGPWGSGKSTVLNYVRHFLQQNSEDEQLVIVDFNPWWFSGQENLARAFLGQLQAVLPAKNKKFEKLGELLSDFAEGVGGLIDLTGVTGGFGGKLGKLIAGFSKSKPKDVPALKVAITKILLEANQRILIIIDDIDRLTPDETRQLFTVIKALADFPNVIYLLAFDREVAANAIEAQSGLPGDRYLEKIIQVPFELPPVDRVVLLSAFTKRLDEVLLSTPEGLFDQSYWINVFRDGIESLIKVPRDVVRFTNTLSVTYPSVVGEVNPVDFIAMEALRVFLPTVYDTVRSHPEHFSGHRSARSHNVQEENNTQAFHDAWLNKLPNSQRHTVLAMMRRIFPKLETSIYDSSWIPLWRSKQRACVPEIFPNYFRLSVPDGVVRRSEMQELLSLASTPSLLGDALVLAATQIRPDGLSKVKATLERLMDYVEIEIPDQNISTFINVLLDVGDKLVVPSDEKGFYDFGNESRVNRIVYHLLKRIDKRGRLPLLQTAFTHGKGIGVQRYLLASLLEEVKNQLQGGEEALLDSTDVDALKVTWLQQVKTHSEDDYLLEHGQLHKILAAWQHWGNSADVSAWCSKVTVSDEGLLAFLPKFCSQTRSQTMGDWAVRLKPRLNPAWLETFIDTSVCADRLTILLLAGQVPASAQEAVKQFLKEFEMLKNGKNPDGLGAFDD